MHTARKESMMEEIKISVIVPVYNTEKYLIECIDSICNQTLKDIEILLINDESTDDSLSILEHYAKKDSRVRVIQNVHTGDGAASARNHGLKLAKGKYLSFLDSDDYFDVHTLEKAYKKAEVLQADIVVYNGQYFHHQTKAPAFLALPQMEQLAEQEVFNRHAFPDTVFYCTTSLVWLCLFNRDYIMKENLTFQAVYHFDDALFARTAFMMADRIVALPEILVYHRFDHAESQATNCEKDPVSILSASYALKKQLEAKGVFQEVRNGHALHAIRSCHYLLSAYPTYESFSMLFDALQNEYIEKLELETSLTNDILHFDARAWIEKVKCGTKEEYIFDLLQTQKRQAFCFETEVLFPIELIDKNDRVIIYGAGNIGTGFFTQNMQHNYCKLVGWVDKNAEDKQYPIEGLDILKTRECDKIIISIDSEVVFHAVRNYLLEIGLRDEQIVYGIQK